MTMGTTADELSSIYQITSVIHRYCRAMDRIDAELGYTVWHEDGHADYGPHFNGTGRELIDFSCDYHRTLVATSHLVGNVLIELDGDRATSEVVTSTELLGRKSDRYSLDSSRGRHLDRWSRPDGVWAIDHRTFVLDILTTREIESPAAAGLEPWGRRDATDPSYDFLRRQVSPMSADT
jgi:hypothetical protein